MSVEIVEMGAPDHRLWALAGAVFRGVKHEQHRVFPDDPTTVAFVARYGERIVAGRGATGRCERTATRCSSSMKSRW